MKHYIVEANYLVPFEEIVNTVPAHRSFLQQGYDRGLFLCSGPKEPPTGGFLVARAKSREQLETLFENEPFRLAKLAEFTITEFNPVKRQDWTEHWFGTSDDSSLCRSDRTAPKTDGPHETRSARR